VLLLSFAFFILPSVGPWFGSQHQMDQSGSTGMCCTVSVLGSLVQRPHIIL